MITIPREICRDLNQALSREWLVTNGRGSYASSTITGAHTRRYHGLLVAALNPPLGRTVLAAKLDEEIEVDGHTYKLGTNEYQNGAIDPDGYLFLQAAIIDGMIPRFSFSAANFKLSKTIWMEYGRDTTYARYELDSSSQAINLTLLPFCTYRDFHSETHGALDWNLGIEGLDHGFRVIAFAGARPYRILVSPAASFTQLGLWYWKFQQRVEAERGHESQEDLYLPGLLRIHLEPGKSTTVAATLEGDNSFDPDANASFSRAQARQRELTKGARDEFERQLFVAADQFLVARPNTSSSSVTSDQSAEPATVLAGYHWFGDWGRDTMISLEGLTLSTGRFEVARRILMAFARFVSDGMLPNRFPDYGETPEYNTVDATLWYFHAIDRYVRASGDKKLLGELFPILSGIVQWHVNGTRYSIHVDRADGLLSAGEPGLQLTWMDAKVGDWVVTPRIGKPVEINALWYNALRLMQEWANQLGEPYGSFLSLADRAEISFEKFWYSGGGYLYDVIDGPGGNDSSMRPNQIFALSLPHCAVPLGHAKSVLDAVTRELLTPVGLRTLSPRHPDYRGQYAGDQQARDGAYHNGTVWPWLMGAYLDAHRRVYPDDKNRRALFRTFEAHLTEAGLGTISECFEGDEPHRPVGCIAQAWSVAEILRAYNTIPDL